MAKQETDILNRWLIKYSRWGRLFRNNCGAAWAGVIVKMWNEGGEEWVTLRKAYRIPFGLIKGSGDYVGWHTMIITPEMVGKKVAVFASVEGKSKDGVLEPDQRKWMDAVRAAGGIAFMVRDPETRPEKWEPLE